MKKLMKGFIALSLASLLIPTNVAEACSAFIIGKDLTADGSTLFGRTEDYPFPIEYQGKNVTGYHNKNLQVVPAQDYKEGDMIEDESNGFTYPHASHEFQYINVPDSTRGTGEGIYGAHGMNEKGVTMTATVTAIPNDKVLGVDPLVEDGLAESIFVTLVLPRVSSAREGIEFVAKVIDEKGSAEGNIIMIADKNELWYMEILSGHQYVAIKFPADKYAIFPNTYFLGSVDFSDTENVIASADVEKVAKEADSYKEMDGKFHIAKSYGPETYAEGDRSRVYAGIKLLDPQAPVSYEDEVFDLMRTPTDPSRRYTVEDAIAIQRNRFEELPQFTPDDQFPKKNENGRPLLESQEDKDRYKYAPGNENVIDAHFYQIKSDLPTEFAGVMWLGLATSRNTPYIPFYGNLNQVHESFVPQTQEYDPTSWYWVAKHIDEMAMAHQEVFGSRVKERWQKLEFAEATTQAQADTYYSQAGLDAETAADLVTKDALDRSQEVFQNMKQAEASMEKIVKAKSFDWAGDEDGDGLSNEVEFLNSSDPFDAKSLASLPMTGVKDSYQGLVASLSALLAAMALIFTRRKLDKGPKV